MQNIKLIIEYDGANYFGFQKQKKWRNTIQEELERALSKLCNEPICVISSGRTDSGVHAKGHVINFKTKTKLSLRNIISGLNSLLPDDIAVLTAQVVASHFHSRFSARRKIYQYQIWNSRIPSPLLRRFTYHYIFPLDLHCMRKAAQLLVGKKDFKAFGKQSETKNNTIRTLKRIAINKKGSLVTITVEGDGFLYNMVRNIVGTLLLVGKGKISVSEVKKILRSKDRKNAGPTVPPYGLTLMEVLY